MCYDAPELLHNSTEEMKTGEFLMISYVVTKGVGIKLWTKFNIVRIGRFRQFWQFHCKLECKQTQNIGKNEQYRKPSHAFS